MIKSGLTTSKLMFSLQRILLVFTIVIILWPTIERLFLPEFVHFRKQEAQGPWNLSTALQNISDRCVRECISML